MEIFFLIIFGFISGITTVVFGFGGGFIVVPFIYQFISLTSSANSSEAMIIAIATSTFVMVFNSLYATYKSWKSGILMYEIIFPLFFYIGIGAIIGSFIAPLLANNILRVLFVLYLLITIMDTLFRKGFLSNHKNLKLEPKKNTFLGVFIGFIAAMLGVGGSVMTVPLLRRRGYKMSVCVSSANPLSFPVALVASIMYVILGYNINYGSEYIGYINLKICLILSIFGFVGIFFARKFLHRINDSVHAKVYVLLLIIVLFVILI